MSVSLMSKDFITPPEMGLRASRLCWIP